MRAALIILILLGASSKAIADHERYPFWDSPDPIPLGPSDSPATGFSIGTLAGVGYATYDASTYKVIDGIVVLDKASSFSRRLQPATYILPSYIVARPGDHPLAVIVPISASASTGDIKFSYGFGFSYGVSVTKAVEIGAALAAIWAPYPSLDAAQLTSYTEKSPLPAGEATTIGSDNKITIVLGLYITPKI